MPGPDPKENARFLSAGGMRFAVLTNKRGRWASKKAMFKGGFYIISAVLAWGTHSTAGSSGFLQKPNGMKIDSVPADAGSFANLPISVTNAASVGSFDLRISYDPVIESLHSITPAVRIADWEYLDTQPDTASGEIHIVGIYEVPFVQGNPTLLQPGSGPVAYLNFKVYDQSVVPGFFTDVAFLFQSSSDNAMHDSLGNLVDSSQIDYVNGGINLGATSVGPKRNLPKDFWLAQNYPNPFNSQTRIDFYLSAAGPVFLAVYDILGRTVNTLIDESLPAGKHSAGWDGQSEGGAPAPSGVYFYRLVFEGQRETKKMVLVK